MEILTSRPHNLDLVRIRIEIVTTIKMNLNNCTHPKSPDDKKYRHCVNLLWEPLINYFHGVLCKLARLSLEAKAGAEKKAYDKFLKADNRDRKSFKESVASVFGGTLDCFPGENGEFEKDEGSDDSKDSHDSENFHVHISELEAIGRHIYAWDKEIHEVLDCFFDHSADSIDHEAFIDGVRGLRDNLEATMDDIRGDFAEFLG